MIKIWATWCGPCRNDIDELNELTAQYAKDTNVVFLAVSAEPETTVQDFLKSKPFHYQHISNAENLKNELHPGIIKYIPQHLVVNPEGLIIFDKSEPKGDIKSILSKEINELKAIGNF